MCVLGHAVHLLPLANATISSCCLGAWAKFWKGGIMVCFWGVVFPRTSLFEPVFYGCSVLLKRVQRWFCVHARSKEWQLMDKATIWWCKGCGFILLFKLCWWRVLTVFFQDVSLCFVFDLCLIVDRDSLAMCQGLDEDLIHESLLMFVRSAIAGFCWPSLRMLTSYLSLRLS